MRCAILLLAALGSAGSSPHLAAEPPPPAADPVAVINRLVEHRWQAAGVAPSPPADDPAFARRVYLDLAGRVPTVAERRAFLDLPEPSRRIELVDALLARPEFGRTLREVFDVVLLGRGPPSALDRRREYHWHAYLEHCFNHNRPWDQVCREMLLARADGAAQRGANWFLFERDTRYQEIAEAISPAVFGVQIQCAQCHDHPAADEIKQRHYWGLVAFFNRGKSVTMSGPQVAESAVGGFSKFADLSGASSDAVLTFLGDVVVDEPRPPDGQKQEDADSLYLPSPPPGTPRVPAFSRRQRFVDDVLHHHPLLARAMVNRLWALWLGRGLVHPVDQLDSQHPPSHPQLLDWLSADFRDHGYDVKRLARAILLSRPYQLAARGSGPPVDPALFAHALDKPLTAEALARSLAVALDQHPQAELDRELQREFRQTFPEVLPEVSVGTPGQALFLSNDPRVQRVFLDPPAGSAWAALLESPPADPVGELFERFFSRPPADDERAQATSFWQAQADHRRALANLAWALATSAEFRWNH
jgi:hypothetical protein